MIKPNNLVIQFSYFCDGCNLCDPEITSIEPDFDFFGRAVRVIGCKHANACAALCSRVGNGESDKSDPLMEHEVYFGKE